MIELKNICKSFDGKDILVNISFCIHDNQKIGLVGKNGIGKSTLLKIIAGVEEASSGEISISNSTKTVGYLKQEIETMFFETTVNEYIDEQVGIKKLKEQLDELEKSDLTDQKKLNRFFEIQEAFMKMDGYNFEYKKQIVLSGLKLDNTILSKKIKELSAGQKSKILISILLLSSYDAILLDEPTNNLDLSSIVWLEKYILSLDTICIIISHDRKLLDNLVNKIIEIDQDTKGINEYTGNYSDYINYKKRKLNKQLEKYERQQEKISDMMDSVKQKKIWANAGRHQTMSDNDKYTKGYERDRSSSLSSSAKRIEIQMKKMDKIERPIIHEPLKIDIEVDDNQKNNIYINCENIVCGYKEGFSISIKNFNFKYGDKILIVGDNGTGKSTFINTIVGKILPIKGKIDIGKAVKIGMLIQDTFDFTKNESLTAEEYLITKLKIDKQTIFNQFIKFGFSYEDKDKRLSVFSPGERTKIYLLICSIKKINTLILDEPTNYLDIEALDAIEEVISSFPGIIIASSHDRQFIDKFNPTYKMVFGKKEIQILY